MRPSYIRHKRAACTEREEKRDREEKRERGREGGKRGRGSVIRMRRAKNQTTLFSERLTMLAKD